MDTLTHIALGACAGEALLGKQLGKKALFIGALANTIPDFDVLAHFWMDVDDNLLAHRGFTHSILFALLMTGLLAPAFRLWFSRYQINSGRWALFFGLELFLHLFIDAFNAYGMGLFEPFSHYRVSLNTIFVADPFYSFWLILAFLLLLILKSPHPGRKFWVEFGLGISTLYFLYCVVNKIKTDADIRGMLKKQQIVYSDYFTTPTPLNNWLWYVSARNDSGYHIGYYSVFDREKKLTLQFFPRNDSLLRPLLHQEDVQHLLRFSKGFYTIQALRGSKPGEKDTLIFNALRFQQAAGWHDPRASFVFYYYLQQGQDNRYVVQRGRFKGWNGETIHSLIRRIKGN